MERTSNTQQQMTRITEIARRIFEVEKRKGRVNGLYIQSLESFRLPLLQIIGEDNELKNYAQHLLNALNAGIEYAKGDIEARKRMASEFVAAGRVAEKLQKEYERRLNIND
ncbi:hypothetical protein U5N28_12060 [Lysinibacillus telephonicus]|uniref:hypothetical protein n=1 Tax=Lysinibacillus telephonicus TaxID=1714840 RepID=UPI003978B0F6